MKYIILGIIVVLFATIAGANTIHVPAGQATIQAGIDAAAAGDTVLVAAGTYYGTGNVDLDFHGKGITLKSEAGAASTEINCYGASYAPHVAIYFHTAEDTLAVVDGFTIRGAWKKLDPPYESWMAGAITCTGSTQPIIRNCVLRYNTGAGVVSHLNANPHIYDCTVISNYGQGIRAGFSNVTGTANVTVERCLITANDSDGVKLMYSGNHVLRNCTIVKNGHDGVSYYADMPVSLDGQQSIGASSVENCIVAHNSGHGLMSMTLGFPNLSVSCSDVYNNALGNYGVVLDPATCYQVDPIFCDVTGNNYTIRGNSICAPANNTCGVLMGAFPVGCTCCPTVIHVPADQATIQAGIDAATTGDTVLVASGVYTGIGNRDLDFHGKNVVLLSASGAEVTLIDCAGTASEPHLGIYLRSGESPSATIEGFTITNAYTDKGAVACSSSAVTIRNSIISGNHGSGFFSHYYGSVPHVNIEQSEISHNSNGLLGRFSLFMDACNISFNDSAGIAAWSTDTFIVKHSLVFDNGGWGIHVFCGGDTLDHCTIVGNGGGVYYDWPPPVAKTSAEAPRAFGLQITNSIIAFNKTVGLLDDMFAAQFRCTDMYGNLQGNLCHWGSPTFGCSGTSFGSDSLGNISADPLFCDTAAQKYYLMANSPCAAANNTCQVDIGAYGVACLCCTGTRGNINLRGIVDLSDLSLLISYLVATPVPSLPCPEAANLNGIGIIDLSDLSALIGYLTAGAPLPSCPLADSPPHLAAPGKH